MTKIIRRLKRKLPKRILWVWKKINLALSIFYAWASRNGNNVNLEDTTKYVEDDK